MKLSASAAVVLLGVSLLSLPSVSTRQEVTAEIDINAPAERVWGILTDFSRYSIWNPYIFPATGEARAGSRLELTLHLGGRSLTIRPTVLTVQPDRELSWSGRVGLGLMERTQTFSLEQLGPRRVRLVSRELFKGFFLLFMGSLPQETQQGLDMMNHALRSAAELVPGVPMTR
jgi:hypothetical protein